MPKKSSYPPRRPESPRGLRDFLQRDHVTWDFGGRSYKIPVGYRRVTTSENDVDPITPQAHWESAPEDHLLAVVVDIENDLGVGTDEGPMPPEAAVALHDLLDKYALNWFPANTMKQRGEAAIATLEIGGYYYRDDIGSLVERLDYTEGTQAGCAGARAVMWLSGNADEWLSDMGVFGGTVHYYRHLSTYSAFRGQGVASRLLAYAMTQLSRPDEFTTAVLAAFPSEERPGDVDRLAGLYATLGFMEIAELRYPGEAAVMAYHNQWGVPWDLEHRFRPPVPAAPRRSVRAGVPKNTPAR